MQNSTLKVSNRQNLTDADWLPSVTTTTLSQQAMMPISRSGYWMVECPIEEPHVMFTDIYPLWFETTISAIRDLLELPENWDSYNAGRIDPAIAEAALNILFETLHGDSPAPSVVPTSAGGIQLEWHRNGVDLEIEFFSPSRLIGYFEDHRSNLNWEKNLSYDLRPLMEAIARLSEK